MKKQLTNLIVLQMLQRKMRNNPSQLPKRRPQKRPSKRTSKPKASQNYHKRSQSSKQRETK